MQVSLLLWYEYLFVKLLQVIRSPKSKRGVNRCDYVLSNRVRQWLADVHANRVTRRLPPGMDPVVKKNAPTNTSHKPTLAATSDTKNVSYAMRISGRAMSNPRRLAGAGADDDLHRVPLGGPARATIDPFAVGEVNERVPYRIHQRHRRTLYMCGESTRCGASELSTAAVGSSKRVR